MRKLATVLILMTYVATAFGQLTFLPNDISKVKELLPEKIKTIRQYSGDFLMNVREYDSLKNLTFSHYKQYVSEKWNGEYLTMITGNIYTDFGKIKKSYHLHSNTGISIWHYEYDNQGNKTKLFIKKNDKQDSLINKNAYKYISAITSTKELINNSKIKAIEKESEKYLQWERTYDSIGNMLTELSFMKNGDTASYQRYEYDENHNNIYFYNEWSEKNHWEYYYEYEKEPAFFDEELETEPKSTNLLQSVRVDYDWREKRKRISNITFFKYDASDRLTEKIEYDKGEFQAKYVFEYNGSDQVTKRISYVYSLESIASIETYVYNKEGNVIKETSEDFRSGQKEEKEYRYEYEYYK